MAHERRRASAIADARVSPIEALKSCRSGCLFAAFLAFLLLLLFESLFELLALFGLDIGTLLTLLVELLFGAQQFDERLLGAVAFLETGADDPEVAAVAIAVARGHGV